MRRNRDHTKIIFGYCLERGNKIFFTGFTSVPFVRGNSFPLVLRILLKMPIFLSSDMPGQEEIRSHSSRDETNYRVTFVPEPFEEELEESDGGR